MLGPKLRRVVESSDLIQDTLLIAIQRLSVLRGRPPAQVLSWLFQAMRFKLLHHLRDQGEDETVARAFEDLPTEAEMSGVSGLGMLIRGEIEELLLSSVQELPEIEQRVIFGIYREQLTPADLARELGRTEPAIRGIHFRGLKRLRKAMSESGP
jgi:RNA polymerase sigma-70 factor (ECF subfamily)